MDEAKRGFYSKKIEGVNTVKKRIGIVLAGMLALTAALPVFSSCDFLFPKPPEPTVTIGNGWADYEGEPLAKNEVRLSVQENKGYLRWAKVDGATGYRIYRADSRFGTYKKVTESDVTETRYLISSKAFAYYKVMAVKDGEETAVGEPTCAFSDNTLIVSTDDDMSAVQEYIDTVHEGLESGSRGQFSSERFALMFLPGEYPEIKAKVGYYTSVCGLGEVPTDVTVKSIYVSDKVLSNQNATCTFWRSTENLTANSNTTWAVSQATSMRRMQINGDLALSYGGWSSGGFLANSYVTGSVSPGSQQQWMSRNDEWGRWPSNSGSHNLVFSGCGENTPTDGWSDGTRRVTNIDKTEKMAEKPFLLANDAGGYSVFVPQVATNTKGISWKKGLAYEPGVSVPLSQFYVANALIDTDKTLNAALAAGKHILLTPGQYMLEEPLQVKKADTVIMGLGYATLKISDTNKKGAIEVAEADGVRLADLLVDAGAYSKNMVVVGEEGKNVSHARNPIVLSNIYLRVGGVANVHTETETALAIYANDTLGDNFWIWRADHSRGVAWEDTEDAEGNISYGNPVDVGLYVGGDNVFCYALMVEHCEGYQTYWKGENGMTVMYQSETPYRVPEQSAWMSPNGKNGYASYKVDDGVKNHRAYGIGIYLVNYSGVSLDSAIEVPETDGIYMYHLVTCKFSAEGGSRIHNVINNTGSWVGAGSDRRLVELYAPKNS